MKKSVVIVILLALFIVSCEKNGRVSNSGTVTINNDLFFDNGIQAYIIYGFLFPEGRLVSIFASPPPDITIDSDGTNLSLEANNLNNSFYLYNSFTNETQAKEAFKNLTSLTVSQWAGSAIPLNANQIWIYRSGSEHYTKIRIISTESGEVSGRDYAECTFEWVYQPDGTLTFPAK